MQSSRIFIDLTEAAYDVECSESDWLKGLLAIGEPLLDHGHGHVGMVYTRPPEGGEVAVRDIQVASGPADFPERAQASIQGVAQLSPKAVSEAFRPGLVSTLSEILEPRLFDVWKDHFDYAEDLLVMTAVDPDGQGVAVNCPLPERTKLSGRTRERWQMLGAHLSAAHRVRRALPAMRAKAGEDSGLPQGAEAILDPRTFEVVHAEGPARVSEALQGLRESAVLADRARGLRSEDAGQALKIWKALVRGRWSLVDSFDSDGRRFVLALPNSPQLSDPRGFTERETQVGVYAAFGESVTMIAYRLGLSKSVVSIALSSAMHKLGAKTQAQLVERLRPLRPYYRDILSEAD